MTNSTKKAYLIYSGDEMPYEPTHVIATFLDKEKAEEYLKKLKEEEEKNYQLNEQYEELYDIYNEYLTNEHIKYDYDGIADEALAKKFGVTKEFAHEVMNFYYYPKIYYMSSSDFYE